LSSPKPEVHIYLLSHLAYADVTDWLSIIKQLKTGRKSMFWSYKPLRRGAFEMASKRPTLKVIIMRWLAVSCGLKLFHPSKPS